MEPIYIRQTELLLRVLPHIHEVGVFALHGGTAINLVHDEMEQIDAVSRINIDVRLFSTTRLVRNLMQTQSI